MGKMTQQALDVLMPTLEAMAADEVNSPNIPAQVTAREALETVEFVRQTPEVKAALALVKVDDATLDAVEQAALAADRAALLCKLTLFGVKDEEALATVTRAEELEQDILGAFRYNMSGDRDVMAKVRKIAEGAGLLDLYSDIILCAELLDAHPTAFADDGTFDEVAARAECDELAPKLQALLTDPADKLARQRALDLRDRAWSHLDGLLDKLREDGKYVFKKQPTLRARFASAYSRDANRRSQALKG
jgi:hypothetical protein